MIEESHQEDTKQLLRIDNLSTLPSEIKKEKEYQYGLDVIRFLATYFVVIFHSFHHNNYSKTHVETVTLFLLTMKRYISYSCNSLFMILTGYLQKEQKLTFSYYSILLHFIIEYFICCIVLLVFRFKYQKLYCDKDGMINLVLKFSITSYSSYVNIFIGLFLLSPFLNILYNNIKTVSLKYVLVTLTVIIFSLPATFYIFSWNHWIESYPIMYYIIGCYIKEFQPKVNKTSLFFCINIFAILNSLCRKYSTKIMLESFQNLGCVIISTSIFLLFYDLKAKKHNCFLKMFRQITDTSLSCILLSWILEVLFNDKIFRKKYIYNFVDRLPYLAFTVPLTFIGSIIMGLFTHNTSVLLSKGIKYSSKKLIELYIE